MERCGQSQMARARAPASLLSFRLNSFKHMERKNRYCTFNEIRILALLIRIEIFKIWKTNRGPISGSLSVVDLYITFFFRILERRNYSKAGNRSFRLIPKATGANALFATLKYAGLYKESDRIEEIRLAPVVRKNQWFGNISGTLTKNFDQGLGLAFFHKYNGLDSDIIVFISEGDIQAGVDQQAKIASAWKLNNLILIIDVNQLQSSYPVSKIDPTLIIDSGGRFPRFKKMWVSYGWQYKEVDGHDYEKIERVMNKARKRSLPLVIVAKTKKGKGVSFIEKDPVKYTHKLTLGEYDAAIKELSEKLKEIKNDQGFSSTKINLNEINVQIQREQPLLPELDTTIYPEETKSILKNWLNQFKKSNPNLVFVIDSDNPYPFDADKISMYTPENRSQHLVVGVNEKMAANIARGIANAGGLPIYTSPANHMQVCADDFMRCAIDKDPVLFIGYRPGSDASHWGLTHNNSRDCLLFGFPESYIFQPGTKSDLLLILNSLYQGDYAFLPAYLRLPSETFDESVLSGFVKINSERAFKDGFYFYSSNIIDFQRSDVLFVASGSVLKICGEAINILLGKNLKCNLVNVINLSGIDNARLINDLVKNTEIVISVIDADETTLSNLLFKTITPSFREKVISRGLNDFGRGLYSREELFRHNKMDVQSLVEIVTNKL